jgi:hypothetical protein
MGPEILIPLSFFGMIAALVLVPIVVRERTKRSAHELVSQALARGQSVDPALVEQLSRNIADEGNRARKSLGRGVIMLALALGFIGAGYVGGGWEDAHDMAVPAVILGSLGVAFILLSILDYSTKRQSAA